MFLFSRKLPLFWNIACALLGLGSAMMLMILIKSADNVEGFLLALRAINFEGVITYASIFFLSGALLSWLYGILFCFRVFPEVDGPKGLLYFALAVILNWLSPFVFILIVGQQRFFENIAWKRSTVPA